MFGRRFFGGRYFAPSYFGGVGGIPVIVGVVRSAIVRIFGRSGAGTIRARGGAGTFSGADNL